jgi:hypothetical protein
MHAAAAVGIAEDHMPFDRDGYPADRPRDSSRNDLEKVAVLYPIAREDEAEADAAAKPIVDALRARVEAALAGSE